MIAAGLSITRTSRLVVTRLRLGTASRFALVGSHRSGVRFQVDIKTQEKHIVMIDNVILLCCCGCGTVYELNYLLFPEQFNVLMQLKRTVS